MPDVANESEGVQTGPVEASAIRQSAPSESSVAHVHKWEPVGTAIEKRQFFDGTTNPWATVTLAIRSCECGAIRRTEVLRVYH